MRAKEEKKSESETQPPDQQIASSAGNHGRKAIAGKDPNSTGSSSKSHTVTNTPSKEGTFNFSLLTIAPDGGWAWVILLVSFWDSFSASAVGFSYSVIQDEATKHFNISAMQSSLFVSVFHFMVFLTGPINAALANRFGFKILNLVGGAVCSLAFGACYWAPGYAVAIAFFSVFSGIGAGMLSMVCSACPGYWFETKRSLAFGFVGSATGIAALAVPPAARLVTNHFTWKAVFFLLSILFAVTFGFGFLIKKPPMMLVEIDKPGPSRLIRRDHSLSIIEIRAEGGGKTDQKLLQLSQHTDSDNRMKPLPEGSSLVKKNVPDSKCQKCWYRFCQCCSRKAVEGELERPMYKSDIFLASRTDVIAKQKSMTQADYSLSVHKLTTGKDLQQQKEARCICCPEAVVLTLKDMLSFSLFKNFAFLLLVAATLLYCMAVFVTFVYLSRTLIRKGLGEDTGKTALKLFGAMMALSRILLGVAFHFFPKIPPHFFTASFVTAGGLCHASLALTNDKIAVYVLGGCMGFLLGVLVPMRSVLVIRYLGLEKLTNAVGIMYVFQAIGSLCGAPLTELMTERLKDDNVMFYLPGIMYTFSGLLIFFLEVIHKCSTRRPTNSALT